MNEQDLKQFIRNIPDFPQPGIMYRDITPLLNHPPAFSWVIDDLAERYQTQNIDCFVAIEARGFIFAAALAYKLNKALCLARKPGKLPSTTFTSEYEMEYGNNGLEMHQDNLQAGQRIIIIDDVLATGGTAKGGCNLVEQCKANVIEIAVLIELADLKGRQCLQPYSVYSQVVY